MQYVIYAGVMIPLILAPLGMILYAVLRGEGESILCMECQQCKAVCPVLKVADDYLGPKDVMVAAKSGKIDWALDGHIEYCSTCGACIERCPRRLDPDAANMRLRIRPLADALSNPLVSVIDRLPNPQMRNMVEAVARRFEKDNVRVPWTFITKAKRLRRHYNIVDDDSRKPTLAEQVEKARQEFEGLSRGLEFVGFEKKDIRGMESLLPKRIVFFEGCITSRVDYSMRLATHLLLQRCVDRGVLDEYVVVAGERCCGVGSKILGDVDNERELIMANIQALERTGIKDVLFTCGDCTASFGSGEELARRGFSSMNILEFVYELCDSGLLDGLLDRKLSPDTRMTGHYHCHLRRFAGIRMEDILPGIAESLGAQYVELPLSSTCCGAGSEGLEQEMASRVVLSAEEVGADLCPMACAGCEANLSAAAAQSRLRVRFRSLQAVIACCFSDLWESIEGLEAERTRVGESGEEFPDFAIHYKRQSEVPAAA